MDSIFWPHKMLENKRCAAERSECWAAVKAWAASDGQVDGKRAVCKGLVTSSLLEVKLNVQ